MQSLDNNTKAFFALVRSGIWETDVRLSKYEPIDYSRVLTLAEEQSVVGLVAAGLDHVADTKAPKEIVLQFVGQTLHIEQQNKMMNHFIGELVGKMRKADIYPLLVKGQGIAQSYERPMWRACGDVDLLLSEDNYFKAQSFLLSMADSVEPENERHQTMSFGSYTVELHGNQRCGLSSRMDSIIDKVQKDVFYGANVRSWMNDKTVIFLPSPDNDVIFIFTHFLKHFYKGGLGLRQICDWCRLLWTYKKSLNTNLLKSRIEAMGLMSEWKAFAAYAVDYLGMPIDTMPLFDKRAKWSRKAKRINNFILEVGNMGHNREASSGVKPFIFRKWNALNQRISDVIRHAMLFPIDSARFLPNIIINGMKGAAKGIG